MSKQNADSVHEFISAFALEMCVARLRGATKRGLRVDLNRVSADEYAFRAHGGLLHLNSVSGTLTRRGDATEVTTQGERDWLLVGATALFTILLGFLPQYLLPYISADRILNDRFYTGDPISSILFDLLIFLPQIALFGALVFAGHRLYTGHHRVARQINQLLTDVITDLPAAMQVNAEGEIVSEAPLIDEAPQQRQIRS